MDDSRVCHRVVISKADKPVILEVRLFYSPDHPKPFVWYECATLGEAMKQAHDINYAYGADLGKPERIIDGDSEHGFEAMSDYWDEHGM